MKMAGVEKLPQMALGIASQRKESEPYALGAIVTSRIRDPRDMERAELEAYLQSSEYFPTKASLLEFARRYNVPVNARTQREEIIRLCLRMIYDIPASFAGLRAAERTQLAARNPGAEARKALEDFFVGAKPEERAPGQGGKKIAADLLEGILRCHESGLLLTQAHEADVEMFRHALETCENPIDTHVRFLSNLVDFARLEAGKSELAHTPLRLSDCVGGALKRLAFAAHQKGLELCYAIRADTPENVIGDPARLQQTLIHLVDNAIKFTDAGEIVIEVKSRAVQRDRDHSNRATRGSHLEPCEIEFSVRDTGVGLSQEQLRAVTLLCASQKREGSPSLGGLGLLIAHRLIQLMEGQLTVVSERGKGSTFCFSAQLWCDDSQRDDSSARSTKLHGRRILVVDDNAAHQRIVCALLQAWGAQPTLAASAREALAFLYAQPDEDPFAAIVIDGHLSDLEGFASIRRQHLVEDPTRVSPVIMMLASVDPTREMERYRELHVTAFLQKPLTPAELFQALLEALVSGSALSEAAVVDRTALWSLVAGDPALLRELIGLFDYDCPRLFFTLQQAVMTRNCRETVAAARALKGAISHFAARGVVRVLAVIESFGGQGDFQLVQETMGQLALELTRLRLALDALRQELASP